MKKVAAIAALLTASVAYGMGMGAGGFYALSMPMGDVADNYEMGIIGFGGKAMIGVMPYLNVDVGFGYHMKYKGKWEGISKGILPPAEGPAPPAYPDPDDVDDYYLTTIPITFGVSYPMTFDSMGVYFGGGGAFVMEKFNVGDSWTAAWSPDKAPFGYQQTAPEDVNKPGFYVGGGFKYGFTDKLALDVNPRWMMVLDAKEDDADTPDVDESTSNSMFIDFLIGVDYAFM
jgi:opacity protein-like surface antigen